MTYREFKVTSVLPCILSLVTLHHIETCCISPLTGTLYLKKIRKK